MNTLKCWAKDAALRAVKTAAQTAVALLGTDAAGLTHADWATVGITAALAGGVSVLHNLASLRLDTADASADEQPVPAPAVEQVPAQPAPAEATAQPAPAEATAPAVPAAAPPAGPVAPPA